MHFLGMEGNPRRYAEFTAFEFLAPLQDVHEFISMAAFVTIAAQFIFVVNFFWCLFRGKRAEEANPWEATTLEWTVPSPPPHENFGGRFPTVYRGPYEYGVPGASQDYVMQDSPEVPTE
jgi:cytochrome c oxidase subunit 1